MIHLPLQLTIDGALADARGEPLTPADAEALLRVVNAAWLVALADAGSVIRWRIAYAGLVAEVERAQGEETNAVRNQDY